LAGPSDKRPPLGVLIPAWALSDKEKFSPRIALTGDSLRPACGQAALATAKNFVAKPVESGGGGPGFGSGGSAGNREKIVHSDLLKKPETILQAPGEFIRFF
jgi:hypothetical protein